MTNTFALSPRSLHFSGPENVPALQDQLIHDKDQLKVVDIKKLDDVVVTNAGLTTGGYRYTWPALSQLVSVCGPGLYTYLKDTHENRKGPDLFNHLAVMLNNSLKFNFDEMQDTRLICTDDKKTVDGHVGKKYVVVHNATVFGNVLNACTNMRGKPEFHSAHISGRDLTTLFFAKTPISSFSNASIYRGLLVQNRETSGRSIRLTNLLMDSYTGTWSADNFYPDTRIAHVASKTIQGKIDAMTDVLGERQPPVDTIVKQFEKSFKPVDIPDWGVESKQILNSKISGHLSRYGLPKHIIETVQAKLISHPGIPLLHDVYGAMLSSSGELGTMYGLELRTAAYFFLMRLP